ncbi:enoyl-CoA hydratase/isomerase family protein [Marinomonas ostreistagni]|uniref:enoyl-CoA hydratase/isomerase family protein n=1 Tax=Marinomonas ostreistagni TaxID=359209 RepID=UPI00194E487C|nr:enoyl-CoA hydratase/isomerase family protein [Marinomonas ostreistagni]MBM6551701.1 enoyl-CoA hydratase/isomerase family protein [Marinomonas ostreistagni]
MSQSVEFSEHPFAGQSKLGQVRLNAPKAINALSLEMIEAITHQLEVWSHDPHIAAIWLEGAGSKGFCAGGNVVDVYHSLKQADQGQFSYRYFHTEYQLDYFLATYPKPIICWGNGYVMGGGMGLFMASQYRLVTPSSRLAMPEIAIGLYPDVGASYFLNKLPQHIARFLALTAYQVNATDACELGMATHYVCDEARDSVLKALAQGDTATLSRERVETHIERVLYNFSMADDLPLQKPELQMLDKDIAQLMTGTISTIEQAMMQLETECDALQRARETFLHGSALSAAIILKQLDWAVDQTLEQVLERETLLSLNVCLNGDFVEGVRALLIDKDKQPKWRYSSVNEVPDGQLHGFFIVPDHFNQLQAAAKISSQSLVEQS